MAIEGVVMRLILGSGLILLIIGIFMPVQQAKEIESYKITSEDLASDNLNPEVTSYIIDKDNTIFDQFTDEQIGYSSFKEIFDAGLEHPEFSNGYFVDTKYDNVYFVSVMPYQDDVYLQFTIEIGQDYVNGPYIYTMNYDFLDENNRQLYIPTQDSTYTGQPQDATKPDTDLGASWAEKYIDFEVLGHNYSEYINDFNMVSQYYASKDLDKSLEGITTEFPSEKQLGLELLDYTKVRDLYQANISQYIEYYSTQN